MFSKLFGKRDKSADSPSKEAQSTRVPLAQAPRLPKPDPFAARFASKPSPPAPRAAMPTPAPLAAAPRVPAPAPAPIRTPAAAAPRAMPVRPATAFPADHQIDFELPTAPQALEEQELTLEQRKNIALATVEQHHQRIANTIRTLWGYKECSVYINRLIMAGGDGMGHARVGFNQDAVQAMLALSDVHDSEFGAPSTLGGALGLSI